MYLILNLSNSALGLGCIQEREYKTLPVIAIHKSCFPKENTPNSLIWKHLVSEKTV